MIFLSEPTDQKVNQLLLSLKERQFTYATIGMTKENNPTAKGYKRDHNRICLGKGTAVFNQAVIALNSWQQFKFDWLTVSDARTNIEEGSTVGLICSLASFWGLFACRIVYVINVDGPIKKYGFAYGTLPGHPETGEERFTIELHESDESIWYDLLAYSKPGNLLTTIGYPLTRAMQKKFVKDSQRAMINAVKAKTFG